MKNSCILNSNPERLTVMKKIYIAALVVIATAALNSCVQEKSFKDVKIGKNDLVFSLQGSASTRAAEVATVQKGVKLELAAAENGQRLFLEETIEDLNYTSPATKGTPAYTENVGKLYENLGVVIKNGSTELLNTTGFYAMDDEMVGGGWRYQGEFDGWLDEDTALDFYLWMPVSNNGITNTPTYGKANGKQTISFSYTSPEEAANQVDLIFAARPLSKSEHDTKLPDGAPFLFNHALTAVKFAIDNYSEAENITIKSITFEGLVGNGSCVITPASENNYRDNSTTEYSSAADGVVVWTPGSTATFKSGTYDKKPVDYATGGSFGEKGNYPNSFAQAGNTNNLNKADASQTFWFIPQAMTDDVKLTIVYTFGTKKDDAGQDVDNEMTGVLEFGKALSGVTWKAGQLRTYTIRVDEVNVKIEDAVVPVSKANQELTTLDGDPIEDEDGNPYLYTYYGGTKSNVVITNTGNTDAYIRAALIGQWLDENGNPVFGFTDYTAGKVKLVDSWYQDQFVSHNGYHGYFVDLAGYKNTNKDTNYSNPLNDWFFNSDGYYYYKNIVREGEAIPSGKPLFTSYTVDKNPAVVVAGAVKDVYFTLEISTQAVTAKKSDGTDATLTEAWSKAGVSVTFPSN